MRGPHTRRQHHQGRGGDFGIDESTQGQMQKHGDAINQERESGDGHNVNLVEYPQNLGTHTLFPFVLVSSGLTVLTCRACHRAKARTCPPQCRLYAFVQLTDTIGTKRWSPLTLLAFDYHHRLYNPRSI